MTLSRTTAFRTVEVWLQTRTERILDTSSSPLHQLQQVCWHAAPHRNSHEVCFGAVGRQAVLQLKLHCRPGGEAATRIANMCEDVLTLEVPEPEEGREGRARVASYTVRLVWHRVPA